MSRTRSILVAGVLMIVAAAIGGLGYVKMTGLRGQPAPGVVETRVARTIRGFAIPSDAKVRSNPLPEREIEWMQGLNPI